jgi:hypothetical protein
MESCATYIWSQEIHNTLGNQGALTLAFLAKINYTLLAKTAGAPRIKTVEEEQDRRIRGPV